MPFFTVKEDVEHDRLSKIPWGSSQRCTKIATLQPEEPQKRDMENGRAEEQQSQAGCPRERISASFS